MIVKLNSLPWFWTPKHVSRFAARVVSSHIDVNEGAISGSQRYDDGLDPPDAVSKVRFAVNPQTGEFITTSARLWFNSETDARIFVDKLPRYLDCLQRTGGFDVAGCGWRDANVSAASDDSAAAKSSVTATLPHAKGAQAPDDAAQVLAVLHSFVDAQAPGEVHVASQATRAQSLLDLHVHAEQVRAAAKSDAKEHFTPAAASMVMSRALNRRTAEADVDRCLDTVSLESIALCPDLLWNVHKKHARRFIHGDGRVAVDEYRGLLSPSAVYEDDDADDQVQDEQASDSPFAEATSTPYDGGMRP